MAINIKELDSVRLTLEMNQAAAQCSEAIELVKTINKRIHRLQDEQRQAQAALSAARNRECRASTLLFLKERGNTSEEVFRVRKDLAEKKAESGRGDITVDRQKQLALEMVDTAKKHQEICPHAFVLYESGCKGTSCEDYTDRKATERACIICGLKESDYSHDFERLTESDMRLFRRANSEEKGFDAFLERLLAIRDVYELLEAFYNCSWS